MEPVSLALALPPAPSQAAPTTAHVGAQTAETAQGRRWLWLFHLEGLGFGVTRTDTVPALWEGKLAL